MIRAVVGHSNSRTVLSLCDNIIPITVSTLKSDSVEYCSKNYCSLKNQKMKKKSMEFKKALIWSVVNEDYHSSLSEDDKTIKALMPLISTLFPGINYFSVTGFSSVLNNYVKPVIKKQFPELSGMPDNDCSDNATVSIESFLPSDGYEHLDNPEWKKELNKKLNNE